MTNEGLILEKSRRPDTKPYKSILLPFNETSFWENWGKRGDNKYRFGFTLRVPRNKMQMDVAVDSDRVRLQWMNVLDLVFGDNVRNTKELLKCLADREGSNLQSTKSLSGVTNDFKYGRGLKVRNVNGSNIDSISQSFETLVYAAQSPVIPRRFCSDVYDDDGYMSDNLERNRFFYFKSVLSKIVDKESDDNEDGSDDNGNCVLTTTETNTPLLPNSCVNDDHTSNSCCHSHSKDLIDEIVPTSENSSESNQSVSVSEQNSIHLSENILNILNGASQTSNEDKQPIQLVSPTPSSFTLTQKMEEITPNDNICSDDNIDMQLNVVGHRSKENNMSYEVGMIIA